jgi:hypothetical protein
MTTSELKALTATFDKLVAGRHLEGRAKQLAFNITRQLENARRTVSRGKPLVPVTRKLLVEDIDELTSLLPRGDAGVSP